VAVPKVALSVRPSRKNGMGSLSKSCPNARQSWNTPYWCPIPKTSRSSMKSMYQRRAG
jgi:hypothetical protein